MNVPVIDLTAAESDLIGFFTIVNQACRLT
jgi:hypothetical protein